MIRFYILFIILFAPAIDAFAACVAPGGVAGEVKYMTPDLKYCDGSTWKSLSVANLGTSCSSGVTPGTINWLSPNLRFCNGTNWIRIKTSIDLGAAAGTTAGTMVYDSSLQKMKVSFASRWFQLGFYPVAPTGLSISHTQNSREITINWTAGTGNGNCNVQYRTGASSWATVTTADCDTNVSWPTYLNNSASFNGYKWDDSGTDVRIQRVEDGQDLYSAFNHLTCTATSSSTTPTPDIDEDCDRDWDRSTGQNVVTVPGNIGTAYTCPATYTNGTFTGAFTQVNFEADMRTHQNIGCSGANYPLTICAVLTTASGTIPVGGNKENYDGTCDWSNGFTVNANTTSCQNYNGQARITYASTQWNRRRCNYVGYF